MTTGTVRERCIVPRVIGALCLVPLLAACQIDIGENTMEAEFARKRAAGAFQVTKVENGRAVVMARGREVRVTPGPGACVAEDAIDLSERSAFLLFADCAVTAPLIEAKTENGRRLEMAQAFPGLITLSLAGEPRAETTSLETFLRTPAAERQIARGADEAVSVEEVRVIGDAVLVHARADDGAPAMLSSDFWRGFVDLNGRMGVLTVSAFAAADLDSEALFGELMRQVNALYAANGGPIRIEDGDALIGLAKAVEPAAPAEEVPAIASLDEDLTRGPAPQPSPRRGTPTPGIPLPPTRPAR